MEEKNIELFPCISEAKISTSSNILHSIKEFTFKVENISGCGRHIHENYLEMFVVLKGELRFIVNKNEQLVSTGFFCLMTQGTEHHFLPFNNRKARIINLTCYFQTALKLAKELFNYDLLSNSYCFFKLSNKQLELVNNYVSFILSSNNNKDEITVSFVLMLLSIYVSSQTNNKENSDLPKWLQDFLFHLNNINLQETKISDLYKLSGYSQSRFSVLFYKYMHVSLVQYINNLKLEYACSLLSQTDNKIIYICDLVGFSSIAHFNTLFKDKYGISPTEYRKRFSSANSNISTI